jgi:HlyD family secretion protein
MRKIFLFQALVVLLAACNNDKELADAYGSFEATEVMISAESNGRIVQLPVREGEAITEGQTIALLDTTLFHLQKEEANAGINTIKSRTQTISAQNEILRQQIGNLQVNLARTENMLKEDAATQKQFDDLAGQVAVLEKQISANNTQNSLVDSEIASVEAKKALLDEQIRRCHVKSPLNGTILTKYAEAGEMITAGRPLVKIADLSIIRLKVFVSGAQLGDLKIGNPCTIRVDDGSKGYKSATGTISHIADKAEFTPKIIQTKEERVTLVYAVTIDVENDGTLKPGMPGEAIF